MADTDNSPRASARAKAETVTAAQVIAWMTARPGASWQASIQDVEAAVLALCDSASTP